MKFWKLGFAFSCGALLGIVACDNSSSTDDNSDGTYKEGTVGCKVISQIPYEQETQMNDLTIKLSLTLNDDKNIVQELNYNKEVSKDTCDHYKIDPTFSDVTCTDNSIKATFKDVSTEADYEAFTEIFASVCTKVNGTKIPETIVNNDFDVSKIKKCTTDNEGKDIELTDELSVVCKNDVWVPSKLECADDGEKIELSSSVVLLCKDKKWALESEKKCSDSETKKENILDLIEISATCVDGVWLLDLPNEEASSDENSNQEETIVEEKVEEENETTVVEEKTEEVNETVPVEE